MKSRCYADSRSIHRFSELFSKATAARKACLQLAKDNQIPVHEDPALIEILSKMNLDEHIPGECYRVVAEILAWIYKAQLQAAK